jgi:RHH-type proline utilization regulon transcriptional repressor/proline dehydrogenase/delta 1-pyrroline-5-carboxylate dehydrogenase
MGLSAVGPGMKAGGPNYVACFMDFHDRHIKSQHAPSIHDANLAALAENLATNAEGARIRQSLASYDRAWRGEFAQEHDHFKLLGQDNIRRYLPFSEICVRITPKDTWFDVVARVAAARVTGARVLASFAPDCPADWYIKLDEWTDPWAAGIELLHQTDEELIGELEQPHDIRIRYGDRGRVPLEVRQAAARLGQWIADSPVVSEGRIELLWYVREQSISYDYHRYGNLGTRATEIRRPLVVQAVQPAME